MFVDLFSVEPNVLKYFDAFREVGVKNILQSRAIKNHGVRIMNLVKLAVDNLNEPDKYKLKLHYPWPDSGQMFFILAT